MKRIAILLLILLTGCKSFKLDMEPIQQAKYRELHEEYARTNVVVLHQLP